MQTTCALCVTTPFVTAMFGHRWSLTRGEAFAGCFIINKKAVFPCCATWAGTCVAMCHRCIKFYRRRQCMITNKPVSLVFIGESTSYRILIARSVLESETRFTLSSADGHSWVPLAWWRRRKKLQCREETVDREGEKKRVIFWGWEKRKGNLLSFAFLTFAGAKRGMNGFLLLPLVNKGFQW